MKNKKTSLENIETIQKALKPLGYLISGYKDKYRPERLTLYLEKERSFVPISSFLDKPS